MGAIREGRWRCASCNNENLGRFEQCRSCPAGRTTDTAFYLPEGEPAISDEALLADAMGGADWHCDHCENSNKGTDHRCWSCGNGRDHNDKAHDAARDVVMSSGTVEPKHERPKARPDRKAIRPKRYPSREDEKRSEKIIFISLISAALFLIMLFAGSLFVPFKTAGMVTEKSWSRAITIEHIRPVEGDGWSLPSAAYDVSSERKIRNYETVTIGYKPKTETSTERYASGTENYSCGKESMGNGYFRDKTCTRTKYSTRPVTKTVQVPITEQRAVYDTWYEYTKDRWVTARTKPSNGTSDEPYWAEYKLADGERVGSKSQSYTVVMQIGDDVQKKNLPEAEWDGYLKGDKLSLKTNYWGKVLSFELID